MKNIFLTAGSFVAPPPMEVTVQCGNNSSNKLDTIARPRAFDILCMKPMAIFFFKCSKLVFFSNSETKHVIY